MFGSCPDGPTAPTNNANNNSSLWHIGFRKLQQLVDSYQTFTSLKILYTTRRALIQQQAAIGKIYIYIYMSTYSWCEVRPFRPKLLARSSRRVVGFSPMGRLSITLCWDYGNCGHYGHFHTCSSLHCDPGPLYLSPTNITQVKSFTFTSPDSISSVIWRPR